MTPPELDLNRIASRLVTIACELADSKNQILTEKEGYT
jgi:hypothetical protein